MSGKIDYKGLTNQEVLESRQKHGENLMTPPEKDPWWKLYLEKFNDPIIRILIIAAVISIIVGFVEGSFYEGIGIILAILLATTLAFLNEFKAGKEFEILNKVGDENPVKVIRNGNHTTVPKREVVVGDIVIVETGEEIPADGIVLEATALEISESKLTGESLPVKKAPKSEEAKKEEKGHEENAYSSDRVLSGTNVMSGHGILQIVSVGNATEVAKTVRASMEDTNEVTPLNKQLDKLSKLIGVIGFSIAALIFASLTIKGYLSDTIHLTGKQWGFVAIAIVAVVFMLTPIWKPIYFDALEFLHIKKEPPKWIEEGGSGIWIKSFLIGLVIFGIGAGYAVAMIGKDPSLWVGLAAGKHFLEFFMIAVTIIVVAVPEGLPMSVTLSLAYSMRKMMATNNLVRKMHACETIGAATVICTDKTGTLTMNEMKVFEHKILSLPAQTISEASEIEKIMVESICVNTTVNLDKTNPEKTLPIGNPTEGSLVLWVDENKIDYTAYRNLFRVDVQIPFSTERKYMATGGLSNVTNKEVIYMKGAPEIVLSKCSKVLTKDGIIDLTSEFKKTVETELIGFQSRGMRTLGFALKNMQNNTYDMEKEVEVDMIWMGFFAISDPVRKEVPNAIKLCRDAGIDVKIITGDNPLMAREIGKQINSIDASNENLEGTILTGPEFNTKSDEELIKLLPNLKVLSRAKPLDKLKTVKTLKAMGHVVAVTGDGTNDAPALNYADVGLSMGKTGTSVAKDASDIIILDDSFTSIVNAVKWGRSLYQNIQRFVLFQLTINFVALTVALFGPFIGISLPFTVTQMLWINLIMDTFAALALATEPPHDEVMKDKPRHPEAFIITPNVGKGILFYGILFVLLMVGMIFYFDLRTEVEKVVLLADESNKIEYDKYIDYIHRLTMFFTTFVMLQFWNLFNARCMNLKQSAFKGLFENKAFLLIALAIVVGQFIVVQLGGEIFRTVPLSIKDWGIIIGGTSIVLWIGEIKRLFLMK